MTQTLSNILNNAAGASPEKIALHIEQLADNIIFNIIDSGTGLNAMIQRYADKQVYSNKNHGTETDTNISMGFSDNIF